MDFQVLTFSNVSIESDRVSCVDSTGLSLAAGRLRNRLLQSEKSFYVGTLLHFVKKIFIDNLEFAQWSFLRALLMHRATEMS